MGVFAGNANARITRDWNALSFGEVVILEPDTANVDPRAPLSHATRFRESTFNRGAKIFFSMALEELRILSGPFGCRLRILSLF